MDLSYHPVEVDTEVQRRSVDDVGKVSESVSCGHHVSRLDRLTKFTGLLVDEVTGAWLRRP